MMRKPNIIFFFCDELRCDALSCYPGTPGGIKTPNLDRLASMGVLFEQCFCNSPVCVPSRYSMLTGQYPESTGVFHNEAAMEGYCLNRLERTIPEILEEQGYVTANFGKQHLPVGVEPFMFHDPAGAKLPIENAWKKQADIFATKGLQAPIGGIYPKNLAYPPNQVTQHALEWIRKQDDKNPWMARISYLQPHTPVLVPEPYASMYQHVIFSRKDEDTAELSLFERKFAEAVDDSNLTEEQVHQAKIRYYGLVRWIDDQVGLILEQIEKREDFADTIFLFGADHGAMLGENHRYGKQNFACWSHRVPLLIAWPAKLKAGQRRSDICENLDLGKTLFGLLGMDAPESFQGRDLFDGSERSYVYASIGYGTSQSYTFPYKKHGKYDQGRGWPRRSCIRSLEYRLDMNTVIDGRWASKEEEDIFLADLKKDPLEQHNVAADPEYREIMLRMRERLLEHIKEEQNRSRGL